MDNMNKKFITLFFLTVGVLSIMVSCTSTRKKSSSTPTEFQEKERSQVGPVNNPRYFGKQFADDTPVESVLVEGRSQIFASGEQSAYDAALEHALRNAVEIVLGTMIDTRTMVDRGVLIDDKIYSRAYGYVKTYEVIEERNQGNTKYLKVQATVVIGDVRDDALALGILQDRIQRPLIAVVVDEKDMEGNFNTFLQAALEEKLLDKQFEIIYGDQMEKVLTDINTSLEELSHNTKATMDFGIESGAQIVIKGEVEAAPNDLSNNPLFKNNNLKSVNVTVRVEGYNVGDARLLSVRQMRDNGVGLDEKSALKNGIEKIVDKLGDDLIDDMLKKWDIHINNGFEYTVMISGIPYNLTTVIRNNIPRRIQGIRAVFDRGYQNNLMNLLIRFQGTSEELVRSLLVNMSPEVNLELKRYDQSSILLYRK